MVLHGGQANLTKDEYSQMSQLMSSRPWSQFDTGASCGGSGCGSGSGSCGSGSCGSGSGSSASSTPAVATSSPALPKAICDAPVTLSRASAPRSDWAEIVKDWLSKSLTRKTKKMILYFDGCPHRAFKDRMHAWGYFIEALMLYNISSKHSIRFDFT